MFEENGNCCVCEEERGEVNKIADEILEDSLAPNRKLKF